MFDILDYYDQCKNVIIDLLRQNKVCLSEKDIGEIVEEVLGTTYSIGGSFEDDLLGEIADTILFKRRGIEKYIK